MKLIALASVVLAASAAASPISVTIDAAEAQAALVILQKESRGAPVTSADWDALFTTRGYQRLKQREAQFKRAFTDDQFQAFLRDPKEVAQAEELQQTLSRWMGNDIPTMASRSLAYLPAGATIHATIYPLIKPRTNSFVYQLDTDPAVMLYLDPAVSKDQFANTVSHELFHVGDAQNCSATPTERSALDDRHKAFLEWLGAFGEGSAVLAAAGGPDVHPHWEDPPADRAVWDKAMSNFAADFASLRQFFSDIASGALTGDAIAQKGYTFFGAVQGPWYTVGYKMDVTIEKMLGRPALVAALCEKRTYLATYNEAAARSNTAGAVLPLWPEGLANFFR